jgi:dihydroorotate dehydrogenase (NAD+) catalytic subunit
MHKPDLTIQLGKLILKSPVLAASGPLGSSLEYAELIQLEQFGAVIVKGISLEPWPGNPPPRLAETAAGMLNAIGLQNPGLDFFLESELPRLREFKTRIIVNIIGRNIDEYAETAAALDQQPGVEAIELNISCPNLKAGGMAFGADIHLTEKVVWTVRKKTCLPLLVKLTPNVTDIVSIARAAEDAGADVISLINTLGGMAIDIEKKQPVLGNIFGGLSGPAIMPVALKMVWQVSEAVCLPVLGMGGITSAEDAIQFILAGARAVAVGSGLFENPGLAGDINSGIKKYMARHSIGSLNELEGLARRGGL